MFDLNLLVQNVVYVVIMVIAIVAAYLKVIDSAVAVSVVSLVIGHFFGSQVLPTSTALAANTQATKENTQAITPKP